MRHFMSDARVGMMGYVPHLHRNAACSILIFFVAFLFVSPRGVLRGTWAAERHVRSRQPLGNSASAEDIADSASTEGRRSTCSGNTETQAANTPSELQPAPCDQEKEGTDPSNSPLPRSTEALPRRSQKPPVPSSATSWRQSLLDFLNRTGRTLTLPRRIKNRPEDVYGRYMSRTVDCNTVSDLMEDTRCRKRGEGATVLASSVYEEDRGLRPDVSLVDGPLPRQPSQPEHHTGESPASRNNQVAVRPKTKESFGSIKTWLCGADDPLLHTAGAPSNISTAVTGTTSESRSAKNMHQRPSTSDASQGGGKVDKESSGRTEPLATSGSTPSVPPRRNRISDFFSTLHRKRPPSEQDRRRPRGPNDTLPRRGSEDANKGSNTPVTSQRHNFFTNPQCAERPLPGGGIIQQLTLVRDCLAQLNDAMRLHKHLLSRNSTIYRSALEDVRFFLQKAEELQELDCKGEISQGKPD